MSAVWERVYTLVRQVPEGRVTTYGALSRAMGKRISPAAVGWALRVCPEDVPWHRVVNSKGRISTSGALQQSLLEAEGVAFEDAQLALESYLWTDWSE